MNLSNSIKSIQDIMRKDDGVDGDAQRLGQLTWMLFLKVFDQREEEWEDDDNSYKSPLPESMRWRNWAAYVPGDDGKKKPQIAPSDIVGFVNNELFTSLKELDADASPQHMVIRSVFEDANNYMKSGTQLLAVIEKLEEAIDFHDFKTRASLGDVYEQLLNDLRGAGNAGEFYTPRALTQFMADRLNPSLAKRETVLDPACGTGGFLTATIDHFRNQLSAKSSAEDQHAIETLIRGIEKKQLPHLLCTTNMLLHGIDVPSQIEHRNTLGKGWNDWSAHDKVDCVITNPPFGGYEDDGVGSDYPADLRTRETADMFMALIIKKLLKENGRAAVVLPDGFLFGDGLKGTLKQLLLRDCNLHTIVRLPIFQQMLLNGVAVDSPTDAAALHPDLFENLEQTKKAFQRSAFKGQTPMNTSYREMSLKSAAYRRTGRGRSWQRAWWIGDDDGVVRDRLHTVLGHLAEWRPE